MKPAYTVTRLYRKPAFTVKIPWSQVISAFYEANKTRLYRNKTRLYRKNPIPNPFTYVVEMRFGAKKIENWFFFRQNRVQSGLRKSAIS